MATGGVKVVLSAIAGNGFITIIKFVGWFFSQSPSLLAESIHSVADTLNQVLLFIGLKQSEGDVSKDHPQGKGEARYLWNLISAVGIFFLGFGVTAFHGGHALISGHYEVGPISYIGIGVLIISFVIEFSVFIQAYKEVQILREGRSYFQYLKESDDPTILAVLLEDGVAVFGVILALTGIILGHIFESALFDIIASLFIALLLGLMAVLLAFINGKLLIGKSVGHYKESEIKDFLSSLPVIEKIVLLNTQIIGAGKIRLSLELELNGSLLMDQDAIKKDVEKIKNGDDPGKVLHKSNERMIRITGNKINEIEGVIQEKYPEIVIIDLEIY